MQARRSAPSRRRSTERATEYPARAIGPSHGHGANTFRSRSRPDLLHFVQLLIDQQGQKGQKKYSGADAEYAHGQREPLHLRQ
jgi:hypothetical protein